MSVRTVKTDLTSGSIRDHLLRLSLPMMWGIFALISFQLVNTFYISMLGTEQLAAISFTFPVTFVIFSVFLGFGIAMASVVSRLIGAGQRDVVQRVTTHGLMMVFAASVCVAVLGLAFMDPLFKAMGANDVMRAHIREYMTIYFIGTFFICMPIVGNSALRADGDTLKPAMIMTIAAVANAIVDPILIFGLFGFPRLELQGAAISTLIANACACAAGFTLLFRRKIISLEFVKKCDEFRDSTKRLLVIALPAGITTALPSILNAVIVGILAKTSPAAVAAFGVATRVEAFCFIIMMGLASGMAPIIGQNFGAKKYDRVRETLKKAVSFSVVWSLCVTAVLMIFAHPLSTVFSDDTAVRGFIVLYFLTVPLSYILSNIVSGWTSAFNALGQPKIAASMLFLKTIVASIPAVMIGGHFYGAHGVFIALTLANILLGIFAHLWSWNKVKALTQEVKQA
jgi:putative MATE family efflux protein